MSYYKSSLYKKEMENPTARINLSNTNDWADKARDGDQQIAEPKQEQIATASNLKCLECLNNGKL